MRVLVFGNSGSGKSTHAKALVVGHGVAHLDLDAIVWEPGKVAVQRQPESIRASLDDFLSTHSEWVIEGCYGDLVEHACASCTELVFLNPGIQTCQANNRRRPWEPHKYASSAEQNAMLDALQAWVAGYCSRDDAWSYAAHRKIFDAHPGRKTEYVDALSIALRR
ncbi:shikimate kinase [Rhodanobacter sp. L36]|uniref:shikimate kinase n=1 Tax=Rhodanobacter sp. L36 TaxID=1747221 RepID=UPI00131AD59A|nr:shikimate kinase [Rhodanobacter sp. L36]